MMHVSQLGCMLATVVERNPLAIATLPPAPAAFKNTMPPTGVVTENVLQLHRC